MDSNRTLAMPQHRRSPFAHLCAVAAGCLAVLAKSDAYAVNDQVRHACGTDYQTYCAMYAVGSTGVRACMRANRQRLSPQCRHALATSGEATPHDLQRYERETGNKAR